MKIITILGSARKNGTSARIVKGAVEKARAKGIKAGILRPITLWPFPKARIRELANRVNGILVVEMSSGQMIEDVQLSVGDRAPVAFVGSLGGAVPEESAVLEAIESLTRRSRRGGSK